MSTETRASAEDVAAEYVARDLLNALLKEVRTLPDIYAKLREHEQATIIERLRYNVEEAVRRAVTIIAADERVTLQAELKKVVFGTAIEAVFTVGSMDPARLDLADSRGKACLIVVADPGRHMKGTSEVKGDPDQASLNGLNDAQQIIAQAQRRSKEKGKDKDSGMEMG